MNEERLAAIESKWLNFTPFEDLQEALRAIPDIPGIRIEKFEHPYGGPDSDSSGDIFFFQVGGYVKSSRWSLEGGWATEYKDPQGATPPPHLRPTICRVFNLLEAMHFEIKFQIGDDTALEITSEDITYFVWEEDEDWPEKAPNGSFKSEDFGTWTVR